jgi:DNA-binding transcriptional regulator YiaG
MSKTKESYLNHLTQNAVEAAKAAGEVLKKHFQQTLQVSEKKVRGWSQMPILPQKRSSLKL